jgi:hypothetical protein
MVEIERFLDTNDTIWTLSPLAGKGRSLYKGN